MPTAAKKAVPAKKNVIEGQVVDEVIVDEPVEWGSAVLSGRRITFNQPNPAQLIVLRRLNRQLQGTKSEGRKFLLIAQFLDAVSALMVSDDDREFADLEVLEGRVDLDGMSPLIIAAIAGDEIAAEMEEKKAAPRRVRRARG